MKIDDFDIDKISSFIAKNILAEEFQVIDDSSAEKERQEDVEKQINKLGLHADEKDDEEKLQDEGEEEEEEGEEDVDIEAKPKPDATEDEESGGEFEVQSPDTVPDAIQYSQIEKQVNNLRAGKSLKDEEISDNLEKYFDSLGKGERQALFSYLASVGAILTGGTSGKEATRPSELGITIEPEKTDIEQETDQEDEALIRTSQNSAPIVVGELANKFDELCLVFENYSSSDQHRCMNGQIVDFGSSDCISDIASRISDTTDQRDGLRKGSADRSSLNGTLKYLCQKQRSAQKIKKQDDELDVQSKLNLADSA